MALDIYMPIGEHLVMFICLYGVPKRWISGNITHNLMIIISPEYYIRQQDKGGCGVIASYTLSVFK